jgi:hypothetical protein
MLCKRECRRIPVVAVRRLHVEAIREFDPGRREFFFEQPVVIQREHVDVIEIAGLTGLNQTRNVARVCGSAKIVS